MSIQLNPKNWTDEARVVAKKCLGFQLEGSYDQEYPLPDSTKHIQVRDVENFIKPNGVAALKAAMLSNKPIPPIIVSKDGYIIDGNTRAEAARQLHYRTIPAIVLEECWETGAVSVQQAMHLLGAGSNLEHGRGINKEELKGAILFLGRGAVAGHVASILGVSEPTIAKILNAAKFEDRVREWGASNSRDILTDAQKAILESSSINAVVKKALFFLAIKGMSHDSLRLILMDLRKTSSEAEALNLIAGRSKEMDERKKTEKLKGKQKPSLSEELRSRLTILKKSENHENYLEKNPALRDIAVKSVDDAVEILQHIQTLYRIEGIKVNVKPLDPGANVYRSRN
jgi:hypothetical protein